MKRKGEYAIRKLGLYATYAGYFPLLDLVGQMIDGQWCDRRLLLKVAGKHEISIKTLDTQLRRLMVYARRNAPEQWQEWFGDETVSVELFLQTIATHAAIR